MTPIRVWRTEAAFDPATRLGWPLSFQMSAKVAIWSCIIFLVDGRMYFCPRWQFQKDYVDTSPMLLAIKSAEDAHAS
jgi:hypothetical protein